MCRGSLKCKECNVHMDTLNIFRLFESCQNPNCQYSTCCINAMQEHNAKCSKNHNSITEEKLPFEMFCICGKSNGKTSGNLRKKISVSLRSEAKSAIVTHSMLDVLGLVRKPEEGPSGIRKKTALSSKDLEREETKKATEEIEKQKEEKDDVIVEESNKTDDEVEEIIEETEVVETTDKEKESVPEPVVVEENEKGQEEEERLDETVEGEKGEIENKKDERDEEVEQANETEKSSEKSEKTEKVQDDEETEVFECSTDKSPEGPVQEVASEEKTDDTEKDEPVASPELAENYVEDQNKATETEQETEQKLVDSAVEDVQTISSHLAEEAEKELEVPEEPVGAREQISPVNEMETSEVVQEKASSVETDITSDDIQNIISDVVGEKPVANAGFNDHNIDESASMETETDIPPFSAQDASSRQMEDVAMQISQDESMEVPDSNEIMECEDGMSMETD
ncbi:hypothetical protein NQ318_017817 [Aromia moschata]|uniref:Uncharacterized protein n=1 Tax=Aromia moschata TaxID=1265417 RepID=A0AAV8YEI9_9CUCU|nr:hypothetical protein NQ318_017817 [Aromia moschata]